MPTGQHYKQVTTAVPVNHEQSTWPLMLILLHPKDKHPKKATERFRVIHYYVHPKRRVTERNQSLRVILELVLAIFGWTRKLEN
jgi:hypothetical protein